MKKNGRLQNVFTSHLPGALLGVLRLYWLLLPLLFISVETLKAVDGTNDPSASYATSEISQIEIDAKLSVDPPDQGPRSISGQIKITSELTTRPSFCLYLPYNDENYGTEVGLNRRIKLLRGDFEKPPYAGGQTTIVPIAGGRIKPTAATHLVMVVPDKSSDGTVTLKFRSQIPRLPGTNKNDWFYDGFHPVLVDNCTKAQVASSSVAAMIQAVNLKVNLTWPADWQYIGLGWSKELNNRSGGGGSSNPSNKLTYDLTGRNFAFGLMKTPVNTSGPSAGENAPNEQDSSPKVISSQVNKTPIKIFHQTDSFAELLPQIKVMFSTLEDLFGPYPFKELAVIETSELQRHVLAGVIALNRPRQAAFKALQRDWLNWESWILASALAGQWYGAAVGPAAEDQIWLLEGLREYAALKQTAAVASIWDLFNPFDSGFQLLSFNYQNFIDVAAASLWRADPFAALTDDQMKTSIPRDKQHPLLYIRLTHALKQLEGTAKGSAFKTFLRSVTQAYLHRPLAPADFLNYLNQLPSPFAPVLRKELTAYLEQWFTSSGWPDFAVDQFVKESVDSGGWSSYVTVEQLGTIDFAPTVTLQGDDGQVVRTRAKRANLASQEGLTFSADEQLTARSQTLWRAAFKTAWEPANAVVDHDRESYDSDRFNNKTTTPSVRFFPGSAKNLSDDNYTVFWLPTVYRNPSEPLSLGLQGAAFAYLKSGLFFSFGYAPKEHLGTYDMRRRLQAEEIAMYFDFSVRMDYENDRLFELSATRAPLLRRYVDMDLSAKVRYKNRMGEPSSGHPALSTGLSVRPLTPFEPCSADLSLDYELAPQVGQINTAADAGDALEETAQPFAYERQQLTIKTNCAITRRSGFGLKAFAGNMSGIGSPPQAAFFKPTELAEARLRLDVESLERVRQIWSLTSDLTFPVYLPLPTSFFVLPRQLRWRLLYDYGKAPKDNHSYEAAGLGLTIPFGGDLSGAGAISLTHLSLIGILHTNVDGIVSNEPRFLFGVAGDL